MDRRSFLKLSASGIATASLGGVTAAMSGFSANAANASGYKAVVCVFLLGGMDGHDVVIPYDQTSYNAYASVRGDLIGQHGGTRDRANLLPLNSLNPNVQRGREFALPPEMPQMRNLFDTGKAAIIGNVGPLLHPTTKSTWEARSVATPSRLFSHNDQQATWMSSSPEGAQYGWAGRMTDILLQSGANTNEIYSVITSGGNELFLTGQLARPYQVSPSDTPAIELLQQAESDFGGSPLYQSMRDHYLGRGYSGTNLIGRDVAAVMETSLTANEYFAAAKAGGTSLSTTFPSTRLGAQLKTVAETLSIRNSLSVDRQIFMTSMGGFDTHAGQAGTLPALMSELDGAVAAFYQALVELGLDDDVVLFTASDFGRTLSINGNGTDHGWGSHHFVVGNAIDGQKIHGVIPEPVLGHSQDAGRGRLIPGISVEQFAAPIGNWFGLTTQEVAVSLPNLVNFPAGPLTYI